MSRRTRVALAAAVAALSLAVAVAPASAGKNGPNNVNAKKCQSYQDWVRAEDGSAFQSSEQCTAYAAKGGALVPKPVVLSNGCNLINSPGLDGRYLGATVFSTSFNAGEVVTVTATGFGDSVTGFRLLVGGVVVASTDSPGTLTHTFLSNVVTPFRWAAVSNGADLVDWQVSCAAGS